MAHILFNQITVESLKTEMEQMQMLNRLRKYGDLNEDRIKEKAFLNMSVPKKLKLSGFEFVGTSGQMREQWFSL